MPMLQKNRKQTTKTNNYQAPNDSFNDVDMDALENQADPKQGDWQLKQNRNLRKSNNNSSSNKHKNNTAFQQ